MDFSLQRYELFWKNSPSTFIFYKKAHDLLYNSNKSSKFVSRKT